MKRWQILYHFTLTAALSLILAACSSDSNDVPSLAATPTPGTANENFDNEAIMMAFTECLRSEGLEVADAKVDADGNIQKPEAVEGAEISKEDWMAAWEVCGEILDKFTFEKKEVDRSEQVDLYIELAACMREKGYDLEDPTAETLEVWMGDFKNIIDWDDPDVMTNYEECMGSSSNSNGGKGK